MKTTMNGPSSIMSTEFRSYLSNTVSVVERHNVINTSKKERNLKKQGFPNNFVKLLWDHTHTSKLIILGLIIQVIVTPTISAYVSQQTFVKNATQDFKLLPNSTHDELLTLKSKLKQNTVNFKNKDSTNKTKMYTASINSADYKVNRRIEINRELQQKILYQFDNINDDLVELIKAFHADESNELLVLKSSQSVLYRITRSSPPFNQRQVCSVSKNKLTELDNTIRDALTNVGLSLREINCELNSIELNDGNTDNCDKILKSMQCAVNHLKNGFIQATLSSKILQYTNLKKAYDDLYSKYTKITDEIKREFTQKYKRKFDILNTDYQELKKALNNAITRLKENIEHLIISELSHGHIELAVQKFIELDDLSSSYLLPNIISKAYTNYGEMDNFDNILEFIINLPWLLHFVLSYEKLYEIMDKNSAGLIILALYIEEVKTFADDSYDEPDKEVLIDRLNDLLRKLGSIPDEGIASDEVEDTEARSIILLSKLLSSMLD